MKKAKTSKSTKTSVTLKLDKKLVQEARRLAAEADTSLSELVATELEEAVRKRNYDQAKRQALAAFAAKAGI